MSYKDQFSFTRTINSLLKHGSLLDAEGLFDAEVRRRRRRKLASDVP
jgi:hypothetical protein